MAPINKLFASLLLLLATSNIFVNGCSCDPKLWEANTPEEKAAYIQDESGEDLYVIATFINETSYEKNDDYDYGDDEYEPMVFTFQNTTWLVKEVVWNSSKRPYWPKGTTIQNRDTIIYESSTDTTCCVCGRSFSTTDIGNDFLLPIGNWQFSTCSIKCNMEDEECNDLAAELKKDGGDEISSLAVE